MAEKRKRSSGRKRSKGGKASSKGKNQKMNKTVLYVMIAIIALLCVGFFVDPEELAKLMGGNSQSESGSRDELTVHFIDVGQGDSILITAGDDSMLIDCGEIGKASVVENYLASQGVDHLDYVIGTHPHSDHMGCMDEIVNYYDIGELILPHLPDKDIPTTKYFERFLDAAEARGLNMTEAKVGRKIPLGDGECEIIAPCSEKYGNTNNYSVGVIIRHGEKSFLLTGDAESLAEKEMLESGRVVDVDVYKAGHHGSDSSSSDEFLDKASPEIAVISCGVGNSYGHPSKSTIDQFKSRRIKVYRTDLSGTVTITSDGQELSVSTER